MAARAELFILFFLIIPLIIIFSSQYSRANKEFGGFGKQKRQIHKLYDVFFIKWFFSALSFTLFVIFMVLSLVGFYTESRTQAEVPAEVDIVFALDISYSMLSEDISPSRLSRSLGVIRGIIDEVPGQRYSLVVFKGSSAVSVPMTENIQAIYSLLSYINPAMLSSPGTNLEEAINGGLRAFPGGTIRREEILIFSDGEAQAGDITAGIKRAQTEGVRVHTFAAGTPEGGPIPLPDGSRLTYQGNEVITRLDREALVTISRETGGDHFSVTEPGVVSKAAEIIGRGAGYKGPQAEHNEWYRFFLGTALFFLLVHIMVRIYPWKNIL